MTADAHGNCNSTHRCMKCDQVCCGHCLPGMLVHELELTPASFARVILCMDCLRQFAREAFQSWSERNSPEHTSAAYLSLAVRLPRTRTAVICPQIVAMTSAPHSHCGAFL